MKESSKNQPAYSLKDALNFLISDHHWTREQALTYLTEQATLKGMDGALSEIEMSERKKYLENVHMIPGERENQKDKRWRANVRKADGKRTQVAANSQKELEKAVIQFYRKQNAVHSLDSLFDQYFDEYRKNQVKLSTRNRQKADYRLYIKDTTLAQKDLKKVSNAELEDFLADTVIKHQLCRKRYTSIKTILNGFWDYAIYEGYLDTNTARNIRPLGRKFFDAKGNFNQQDILSEYEEDMTDPDIVRDGDVDFSDADELLTGETDDEHLQYFTAAAERILMLKCVELYVKLRNPAYLAIIMCFFLGVRISELVALTESCFDFVQDVVKIRLVEKPRFCGETWTGYYVSKLLKTDESYRQIPISPLCRQLYQILVDVKRSCGNTSGYLFTKKDGARMTTRCVAKALRYANAQAGLPQRSVHKIRKTVLSRLDMSKLFTLEQIRKWAGHARTSMTLFTHYFYTIKDIDSGIKDCKTFEDVVEYAVPDLEFVFTCIHF